jgi:hypothetical protein
MKFRGSCDERFNTQMGLNFTLSSENTSTPRSCLPILHSIPRVSLGAIQVKALRAYFSPFFTVKKGNSFLLLPYQMSVSDYHLSISKAQKTISVFFDLILQG